VLGEGGCVREGRMLDVDKLFGQLGLQTHADSVPLNDQNLGPGMLALQLLASPVQITFTAGDVA
jgi:hypothetical protein